MPQVLINREPLPHLNFDVELLGDCDGIINELCHRLGGEFEQLCFNTLTLNEITEKPPRLAEPPLPDEASTDPADKPPEETESENVKETETPCEPCSKAANRSADDAESPEPQREDVAKDEAGEAKSQTSVLDNRKRYWMSRISRSPISKRLEGELDAAKII